MANTASYILLAVTAVSGVQVGFVSPPVSTYYYRNHNQPLIYNGQLTQSYHPIPQPFVPLKPVQEINYNIAPVPLPYIAAKGTIEDEDNSDYNDGGSSYEEQHHNAHGEKEVKGYKSSDHHAKGGKGSYAKKHQSGYEKESEGEKKHHHDVADAHGKHHKSGKSYKGGDHGHKKHSSKGEDVTGYHKVFHKDEFKKDHDFYDIADKSGSFRKHGNHKSNHKAEEGGHKKGEHHDAASDKESFAEAEFHDQEEKDEDDSGYDSEEGQENSEHNDAEYEKDGGVAYKKKYEFDDDDYDEE